MVRSALEWSFGVLLLKLTDLSTTSISVPLYGRSVPVWARIQVQLAEPNLVRDHPITEALRLTLSCGKQPLSVMLALVTLPGATAGDGNSRTASAFSSYSTLTDAPHVKAGMDSHVRSAVALHVVDMYVPLAQVSLHASQLVLADVLEY